jgi:hypothetical protein
MMTDDLYAFLMRAQLTEESVHPSKTPGSVSVLDSDEDLRRALSVSLLDEEYVLPAQRMALVYTAIAAFERSARDLIRTVLQDKFAENWWELGTSSNVRTRAETRKNDEQQLRWHGVRGDDLLEYTDLGDLGLIVSNKWELFQPHLNSQTWAKNVFDILEKSRNVIMHSGTLDEHDIVRVGVFIRDWIRQVG